MYIAGFNVPFSSPQVLEALVVYTTFSFLRNLGRNVMTTSVHAETKGGHVRAETMPLLGRIMNPMPALTTFVPPVVYIGALVLNKFQKPEWMMPFALSDEIASVPLDPMWKCLLRVGACAVGFALENLMSCSFRHLGEQWHSLGRRERPRVIQTGPYALVRHPIYTTALLQEAVWSVMFWSYIPLVAVGMTIAIFLVKVPMEEDIIQRDEEMKAEYRMYMKRVPARIIPYVF